MSGTAIGERAAYSLDQLAESTSMSKAYWRKVVREGRLRAKLVGRRVVVLAEDAENFLKNAPDWSPLAQRNDEDPDVKQQNDL